MAIYRTGKLATYIPDVDEGELITCENCGQELEDGSAAVMTGYDSGLMYCNLICYYSDMDMEVVTLKYG